MLGTDATVIASLTSSALNLLLQKDICHSFYEQECTEASGLLFNMFFFYYFIFNSVGSVCFSMNSIAVVGVCYFFKYNLCVP